ncbi:DUF1748-domain-containing protein [Cyathus striatus]|nr:DUF1748-domain-containing protein [Cyathus striatus]
MALGRLFHYAFDAVLLSTVVAGVRRSSGFTPDTSAIPDENARAVAERFLGFGESVFNFVQGTAINSSYFKRDTGSR